MVAGRHVSQLSRSFLTLVSIAFVSSFVAACAGQGDIDRTQPDKVDKTIFLNLDGSPRTFYYRKTTVGVPPTSNYTFEGSMGDLLKVRFDILEKYIVGYRSFDYAVGSETPYTSGDNNMDAPMLMFAVTSHFDVKREYNAGTGEQTNVISENTTDRPWNERQFMRVDWSKNLVDAPPKADPMAPFFVAQTLQTGFTVGQGDQAFVNPDRPIVTRDYIDFATKELRTPDFEGCALVFDEPYFDDPAGIFNCGPAEITYRNSLLPVPPQAYAPLEYPDRETVLDGNNQPLRYAQDPLTGAIIDCSAASLQAAGLTGADCTDFRVDRFSKFGFFRTVRQTYDRQVGATEQGRHYLINRWNIWQDSVQRTAAGDIVRDKNGNALGTAVKDRTTRKITYYLNPEFPADDNLRKVAADVIGHYNQTMKENVAGMLFTAKNPGQTMSQDVLQTMAASVPDIFELKPNSCELANVQDFIDQHSDVVSLVEKNVSRSTLDLRNLTQPDLLKACSALSAVTETFKDDDPGKFTWQRNGDLRYSFLYWVDRPQPSGPLGYGPSSADPETGEIISAAAYIYGANLDTYAKFAVDTINIINGNLDTDDILSGKTISDVLAQTRTNRLARQAEMLTDAARSAADNAVRSHGATNATRLVKVATGIDDQAIMRIKGSPLEKLLLNDDVLPGLIPGYQPGDTAPTDLLGTAMQYPVLSSQTRAARDQRFQTLAQHGCVYMADFADDAILATALKYDQMKLSPADMFSAVRADIFRGLADHETGHTMGLRHNFSASTDALNYDDHYWQIYTDTSMSQTQKEESGLSEYAYASVMDYGSRFNSDIQGLGKYDKAAIRFGYGELIDVIPDAREHAWNGLTNDIFLYDYSKLPTEVGGIDKISVPATGVRAYSELISSLLSSNTPIVEERPYKFCSDEFEGSLDCKTWDYGANQREIVGAAADMYRNYFVFNGFKRGRVTWRDDLYLNRVQSHYFTRYNEAFMYYYFLNDYLTNYNAYLHSINGNAAPIDIKDDLLLASIDALNALGTVIETPEPGLHCPTALSPQIATFPLDSYGRYDSSQCLTGQPQALLNVPDAKSFFTDFSDDYYYRINRVGSVQEKLIALLTLTNSQGSFFRVDPNADISNYSINFYQVFRDQVVKLMSGVIRNDSISYAGTLVPAPTSTDPTATGYQPIPVVDLATYGIPNAPMPQYMLPGAIHVTTPMSKTVRYWTLVLGLARLGSTWDASLDFQNYVNIAVKGADDDFTLTNVAINEYTHPTTGVTYRAPSYNTKPNNIGSDLIDELKAVTGTSADPATATMPVQFGLNLDGTPLPTWYAAKAAVAATQGGSDQTAYQAAMATQTRVEQVLNYRLDIISDIRTVRKQLNLGILGVN